VLFDFGGVILTSPFEAFARYEATHGLPDGFLRWLNTQTPDATDVLALFDVIVESSRAGVRKPDPRFYELACERLGVAPAQAVFLDDLGINLKPARAMGMATIKVTDPAQAIADLESVVGFPLH
jgi:epoxide hydrolase-like predicted phosphatase